MRHTLEFDVHGQTRQLLELCWQEAYVLQTDDIAVTKVDKLHLNLIQVTNSFCYTTQLQLPTLYDTQLHLKNARLIARRLTKPKLF